MSTSTNPPPPSDPASVVRVALIGAVATVLVALLENSPELIDAFLRAVVTLS